MTGATAYLSMPDLALEACPEDIKLASSLRPVVVSNLGPDWDQCRPFLWAWGQ